MTKKSFLFFVLLLLVLLPLAVVASWPSEDLYFIACDVGQGDAILLTKGFNQVLIDGGPNNKVLNCLSENMPFWDRDIELVINTHPDKDHLAGLIDVIQRYNVTYFVSNDIEADTAVYQEFKQALINENIALYIPEKGDNIKLAGMSFKVLWPEQMVLGAKNTDESTNDYSIVIHLKYGEFDAILTGDIDERIEKEIIKENRFNDIEVLKVAHHGSKYSSSDEFLDALKPEIAIISVGKNPWGHPTNEVLQRLENIGSKVLRTDKDKVKLLIN